jgi:hypothetical protein
VGSGGSLIYNVLGWEKDIERRALEVVLLLLWVFLDESGGGIEGGFWRTY